MSATPGRTYELVHRTAYTYTEPVTSSYGRSVLVPRTLPDQDCLDASVTVKPDAADLTQHLDYFGNRSTFFTVTTEHTRLAVTARSTVAVRRTAATVAGLPSIAWEAVARMVHDGALGTDGLDLVALREAVLASRHVALTAEVRDWATPSFTPGRPLAEVLADLAHRIRTE
ncbi:MAG TPA: transglutaminase N-terminal domain-containing protein, partial [Cellulomonas sp.]